MFSTALHSALTTMYLGAVVVAASAAEHVLDGDTPVSLGAVLTCAVVVVSGVWWFARRDLRVKQMDKENKAEIKHLKTMAKRQQYLTNKICLKLDIDAELDRIEDDDE
jgi:hypothetical protein